MGFKGKVKHYGRDEFGEFTIFIRENPNLFVDDGKEAALDDLFGYDGGRARAAWWDDETRYLSYGTCCFNNASHERASGIDAIASGDECNYPVETTMLVSPEDSFLSREVGNRVIVTATRRDQTVELEATINVPGDIPFGTHVREFGIFLSASGPFHDPSHYDSQKNMAMICRSAIVGTGTYTCDGTGVVCYNDEPWIATGDRKLYWVFGEL